jgi:hypothetical protein
LIIIIYTDPAGRFQKNMTIDQRITRKLLLIIRKEAALERDLNNGTLSADFLLRLHDVVKLDHQIEAPSQFKAPLRMPKIYTE